MNKLYNNFKNNGVVTINDLIDASTIKHIKELILKNFKNADNHDAMFLHKSGILELILNKKIRYLINILLPDGILWHCEYLKTPCKQSKPHFNPETRYGSWHRDRIIDYNHDRIDFLDIMIYLNDVGENDGAFSFLPVRPDHNIDSFKKSSKIIGASGLGIFSRIDWWHTATTNVGNNDREVIRLSLAKNMYHQNIQESQDYGDLRNFYKNKDEFISFIFGGNRKWYKNAEQPKQIKLNNIIFNIPPLNYHFKKSYKYIFKNKLKSLINY